MKITKIELEDIIAEELLSVLQEDKYKPPRSDSASRYRRDHPRYKNDRMRKSEAYPGYEEFDKLAKGITELVNNELAEDDRGKEVKKCFTGPQLFRLRQQIYNQLLNFISDYEDSKKKGHWTLNKQQRANK